MPENNDYSLFDKSTQALVYGFQANAAQRMLDFDYACRRETPSVAAIINPTRSGLHKCFWGTEEIFISMYRTPAEAIADHPQADVFINFASFRSAYATSLEALEAETIRTVAIIAEGIPERDARRLAAVAKKKHKWIIGPATVGGIAAGAFKIGNTGGTLENIIESKLHRTGSVAYVSKSGGMSNEINNIISRSSDGVYEGIAIGGDLYPGSTYIDHVMRFEHNPDIKIIVILGEIGGTDEYTVVDALREGRITKPVVAWNIGSCSKIFPAEIQFGHAGARAGSARERAELKNKAFKDAGAIVPTSFDDFGDKIKDVYDSLVKSGIIVPRPEPQTPTVPQNYDMALRAGTIRRSTNFVCTISDERGEELKYCGVPISSIVEQDYGIGGVIGLLWFKRKLPGWATRFLEMVLEITADHGPAVSGAHNAIVAARAAKDLVSALTSGLLTIGPRFGGAINDAALLFTKYCDEGRPPESLVNDMKTAGRNIPGIGHRIKSVTNPDKRVEILNGYAKANFPLTPYLDYALAVEKITTSKRDNLILNVDGCVGTLCCDLFRGIGFNKDEVREFVELEALNALFVIGRSIGFVGHILDQRRLKQGLYRHPYDDILYKIQDAL
ncbi:MAG: citrate/2-methylcitrate synthase [Desulfobacterales bacterium]|nr:citrate/2-methylcitrate synthase [Desulfobacterales bacterium]